MKKLLLCGSDFVNSKAFDYNDKWYAILNKRLSGIDSIYYLFTNTLIKESKALFKNYYCYYPVDAVVIDFLLDDCMPRSSRNSSLSYRLTKKMLGKRITNSLSMMLRKPSQNKVFTSLPLYEKYYRELVDGFLYKGIQHIILIKYNFYSENAYLNDLLLRQTNTYTAIMSSLEQEFPERVRAVEVSVRLEGDYMNGMYCDKEGNKKIAEALYAELKGILQ